MNAGKSTMLLQANHNYSERGMNAQLYTSSLDNRFGNDEITSRIGLKKKSNTFTKDTNIFEEIALKHKALFVDCLLIDEAQFLTKKQVEQLGKIVDKLEIPVHTWSLGGVESLVVRPAQTTHSNFTDEELFEAGIDRRLIRYSVGIESIDDLIEDFKFAIDD